MIDFESLSLPSLKKYRSQFQIRIKPSVPKSELAAAIAEHFASIPIPEETEVIDQFLKALQKNRNSPSETEESSDDPSIDPTQQPPSSTILLLTKKSSKKSSTSELETEISKNSIQSNSKKGVKRNSIPKVESKIYNCVNCFFTFLISFCLEQSHTSR